MSDSNHNEILSEFRAVTNVAEDRAKFYLESANWNLQVRTIYSTYIHELSENASQCTKHYSIAVYRYELF